jgi:transcription elongation GreA/GreB family factor
LKIPGGFSVALNKRELIAAFIARLEQDLKMMKEAAIATYEAATHEESKPENEYDTRGLEASYLAGAQAKRAAEIDEALSVFRRTPFVELPPGAAVQAGGLVELDMEGKKSYLLMMPKGGGLSLEFQNVSVQIVTPASSLGEALVGLRAGDVAEFETGKRVREAEVLRVW